MTVAADVTSTEDIQRIVDAAGPRIDGLANVAGIADDFEPLHEVTDALWERVFAVNVDGIFRLIRAVLPRMLDAERGSIVTVASEAALRGNAAGAAYTASKHAVVGITRSAAFIIEGAVSVSTQSLREEWRRGCRVVAPGPSSGSA